MKSSLKNNAESSRWAFVFAILMAALLSIPQVRAADATWIVNANGNWVDSTNWSGGNVPGSTNSTTSTDIATFGGSITGTVVTTIDADRNIGGITFNYDYTGSGNGYSLKNNILLSDGGVIQEISTATPSGSRISRLQNDVFIQGDGGSATIRNNAASGNVRMFLNGVRGTSTTGNTTTLYLDGSNTAPNTFGSRINNGANGGDLALVKNGMGYWRLTASDSDYSGGTTLNVGRLQYSAGTGSNSTVFGTGTITINGGMLQNTETDAGAKEFTTISNAIVVGGNFQFSTRSNNTTIFSGDVDLTGATRQINVDGTADSKVVLSGVISNGGLTKVGSQTLILQGHNIYTGDTTVNAGTLLLGEEGWLTFDIGANGVNTTISGSATIQLDGVFAFDLSGADATFGNSWSIVDTTGGLTANYGATFNVDGFMDNSGIWTMVDGGNLWKFTESTGVLDVSAVPEPGTVALVSLGLGAILLGLRRRMHS